MDDTKNLDSDEYNILDKEEINNHQWTNRLMAWWSGFSLRTKLLAIATLVVSLLMTGITFFALNSIQRDAGMNDTRYARDLGLLLLSIISLILLRKFSPHLMTYIISIVNSIKIYFF